MGFDADFLYEFLAGDNFGLVFTFGNMSKLVIKKSGQPPSVLIHLLKDFEELENGNYQSLINMIYSQNKCYYLVNMRLKIMRTPVSIGSRQMIAMHCRNRWNL